MTITYLKELIDSIEKTKDSIKYFISMKKTILEAINVDDYISINSKGFDNSCILKHLSFDSTTIDDIIKSEESKLKLLEDELNIVKYTIKDIRIQK